MFNIKATSDISYRIDSISDAIEMLSNISRNVDELESHMLDVETVTAGIIVIDSVDDKKKPALKGSSKLKINKATKKNIKENWTLIVSLNSQKSATKRVISLLDIKFRGSNKANATLRSARALLKRINKDIKEATEIATKIVDKKLPGKASQNLISDIREEMEYWLKKYKKYKKKPKIKSYPVYHSKDGEFYILIVTLISYKNIEVYGSDSHDIVLQVTTVLKNKGADFFINSRDNTDLSNILVLGYKIEPKQTSYIDILDILIPSLSMKKTLLTQEPLSALDSSLDSIKKGVKKEIQVKGVKVDQTNQKLIIHTEIPKEGWDTYHNKTGMYIRKYLYSLVNKPESYDISFTAKKVKYKRKPSGRFDFTIELRKPGTKDLEILRDKIGYFTKEFELSLAQKKRLIQVFMEDL